MSTEHVELQIDQVTLPGKILKSAREAKGLTVEEMSAISHLTKQVIRGIEANEYSDLAGLSFVRGYLKLYAKKLGVDETTVLESFDAWKRAEQGEDGSYYKPRGLDPKTLARDETSTPSPRWYALGGMVVVSLIAAGVVISMQDSTEVEPEIAPRVEAPVDPVRPALVESSDLTVEPEIDQETEVQLSDIARTAEGEVLSDELEVEATDPEMPDESDETVAEAPVAEDRPAPPVETTNMSPEVTEVQQATEAADRLENMEAEVEERPVPSNRMVENSTDDGLRVLSETVTGPNADEQAMGTRGLLEMRFTGESWVEVRDVRGRLVVADLMEAGRLVSLRTFGPVEVLVGAVNHSTLIFNGETLDLSGRSYQNVARVTLGAKTN